MVATAVAVVKTALMIGAAIFAASIVVTAIINTIDAATKKAPAEKTSGPSEEPRRKT